MSTVPPSAPSFFSSAVTCIEAPLIAVRNFVTPPLKYIVERIQGIWNLLQPYLAKIAQFMTTKLGVSLELIGLSIIPLQLYRTVDNKIVSLALLAAGILLATAGGVLLCSSGTLPSFITNVTPIASV